MIIISPYGRAPAMIQINIGGEVFRRLRSRLFGPQVFGTRRRFAYDLSFLTVIELDALSHCRSIHIDFQHPYPSLRCVTTTGDARLEPSLKKRQ
jgi:hypothetical protein